jgi:HAD superfamily hydrolase (TIGR01662 family)
MKGQRAVFLDRDGTINEEVGYLDRIEKLRILPGAAEAIGMLNRAGLKVVVVTNQSGIARGFFDEAFVEETHRHLLDLLRGQEARIDAFYYCPHHRRRAWGPTGWTVPAEAQAGAASPGRRRDGNRPGGLLHGRGHAQRRGGGNPGRRKRNPGPDGLRAGRSGTSGGGLYRGGLIDAARWILDEVGRP